MANRRTATMQRATLIMDASGMTLGRLATQVAIALRGKRKPTFTPNIDAGAYVRVVNLRTLRFTGQKRMGKQYYRHSGYPGGLRSITLRDRWARDPDGVLRDAVFGMLPRNRLRARMLKRLSITP